MSEEPPATNAIPWPRKVSVLNYRGIIYCTHRRLSKLNRRHKAEITSAIADSLQGRFWISGQGSSWGEYVDRDRDRDTRGKPFNKHSH